MKCSAIKRNSIFFVVVSDAKNSLNMTFKPMVAVDRDYLDSDCLDPYCQALPVPLLVWPPQTFPDFECAFVPPIDVHFDRKRSEKIKQIQLAVCLSALNVMRFLYTHISKIPFILFMPDN